MRPNRWWGGLILASLLLMGAPSPEASASFEERFFARCPTRPRLSIHRDTRWLDVHGVLYTATSVMELEVVRLVDWLLDLPLPGPEIRPIEHVFVGIRGVYHRLGHARPLRRFGELVDALQLRELSFGDAASTYTVTTGGTVSPGSGTVVRVQKLIDWVQHVTGDLNEGAGHVIRQPRGLIPPPGSLTNGGYSPATSGAVGPTGRSQVVGMIPWTLPGLAIDGVQWLLTKTVHTVNMVVARTVDDTISGVEGVIDTMINLPRGASHVEATVFVRLPLGLYRAHETWILRHQDRLYAGTAEELAGLTHAEIFHPPTKDFGEGVHSRVHRPARRGDLDRVQPPPSEVVLVIALDLFHRAPEALHPYVIPASWVEGFADSR